ncbi:antibiotic transport system permease [Corynebacterium kutscheri]|nr:ABC transporter permease [Corynebacterium kutscheri]VEH04960.1 antibiotic transport system permease [Corynebacterium kutscheri]VEH80569.1 antibiotic transport system permease [Corynebacterium kutscheri]
MIRQLRLMAFHVRQFAAVAYFARLMVFTTIATTIVQWLAVTAWGDSSPEQGWVRGGIIGMWTTATCAAGIIGFERFKGTLVYLIAAPIGALRALVAPVVAASSFGLLAFPVSWLTWVICSHSVPGLPADTTVITFVLAVLMLYLGCVALTITIAALFVLTPNAISYEGLLVVPIFLLSGVLFF